LSAEDSGVHTSPLRPWIWRTLGEAVADLKLSNFCVCGSKRSIACADHSATHTMPLESDHTRRAPWRRVGGSMTVALPLAASMRAMCEPASDA
jgi:hypothetical protein